MHRKQLTVFLILLGVYGVTVFVSSTFFAGQSTASMPVPAPEASQPTVLMGLAIAGVVLVTYGILGLLGYWFARMLGWPGIYSEDGNWRRWFFLPFVLGLICGVVLVVGDVLFAPINGFGRIPHPAFPLSILASMGAGIGEELLYRGFVFGLWALLLNWLLKRFNGRTPALWIANVIASLAFGASHFAAIVYLTGAASLSEVSPVLLAEVFFINGVIGIVAGWRYMQDGLVAASGVHFWADMVWHVTWGVFS